VKNLSHGLLELILIRQAAAKKTARALPRQSARWQTVGPPLTIPAKRPLTIA
jgi:hypothetical protein